MDHIRRCMHVFFSLYANICLPLSLSYGTHYSTSRSIGATAERHICHICMIWTAPWATTPALNILKWSFLLPLCRQITWEYDSPALPGGSSLRSSDCHQINIECAGREMNITLTFGHCGPSLPPNLCSTSVPTIISLARPRANTF